MLKNCLKMYNTFSCFLSFDQAQDIQEEGDKAAEPPLNDEIVILENVTDKIALTENGENLSSDMKPKKRKSITWKNDDELVSIRYFEKDEPEYAHAESNNHSSE